MAVLGRWREEKEAALKRILIYTVFLLFALAAVAVFEKKFNESVEKRAAEMKSTADYSPE